MNIRKFLESSKSPSAIASILLREEAMTDKQAQNFQGMMDNFRQKLQADLNVPVMLVHRNTDDTDHVDYLSSLMWETPDGQYTVRFRADGATGTMFIEYAAVKFTGSTEYLEATLPNNVHPISTGASKLWNDLVLSVMNQLM